MVNFSERNQNSVPSLSAKSNAADNADVILWADPSTHRLLVDVSISSVTVSGGKSNNAVVPGATNLGVLPAVATVAAPSYSEGFQVGLSTDLAGALRVTGSLSVGGTTDNSAFTAGSSTGTPAMGFYHSTIDAVTDGRSAVFAMDAKRSMHIVIRDAAGNARGLNVDANNAIAVTATVASGGIASGAVASGAIASGAVASGAVASGAFAAGSIAAGAVAAGALSFVKLEDVASAGGDAGVPAMAIQLATPADTAADGDYSMLQMSAGRMWVSAKVDTALPAGTNGIGKLTANSGVTIGAVEIAAAQTLATVTTVSTVTNLSQMNGAALLMGNGATGTGSQRVTIASDNTVLPGVGAGATGAAVPANASYTGFNASTALASAATAGNTVGAMSDKFGRQVNLLGTIRDLRATQTTTISASTSETTIVTAPGASVFADLIALVISNTSASTNTRIDIRDDTAGTIIFSIQSPGNSVVGFSIPGTSIPQTATNKNWTAQCGTSTTDIRVFAIYEKNK